MPAATARIKRDELLCEIFSALGQWSKLEQTVFVRAHYHGQSLEAIAESLELDIKSVSVILRKCDRRLHISLREFRKSGCKESSSVTAETAAMATRCQNAKSARKILPQSHKHAGSSRVAI